MFFNRFCSLPPESPYAPTWDFRVGTSLCSNIDTNVLSEFLLKKEKEIKKLPVYYDDNGEVVDGHTGLGKNSTTSKFQDYKLITWNHPEILKLKNYIRKNIVEYNIECGNKTPNQLYMICWYNVLRFGQKIKPHLHATDPNCYLSGHYNVQVGDTFTCYMSSINQIHNPQVIRVKNNPKEMTLFPSYIAHYTTSHYSLKPRISIAFDLNCKKLHPNWVELF